MQISIPHKCKSAVGHHIFQFEVEAQEFVVKTSVVSLLALSLRILATDLFSDLLIVIVSNNEKFQVS